MSVLRCVNRGGKGGRGGAGPRKKRDDQWALMADSDSDASSLLFCSSSVSFLSFGIRNSIVSSFIPLPSCPIATVSYRPTPSRLSIRRKVVSTCFLLSRSRSYSFSKSSIHRIWVCLIAPFPSLSFPSITHVGITSNTTIYTAQRLCILICRCIVGEQPIISFHILLLVILTHFAARETKTKPSTGEICTVRKQQQRLQLGVVVAVITLSQSATRCSLHSSLCLFFLSPHITSRLFPFSLSYPLSQFLTKELPSADLFLSSILACFRFHVVELLLWSINPSPPPHRHPPLHIHIHIHIRTPLSGPPPTKPPTICSRSPFFLTFFVIFVVIVIYCFSS